MRTLFVDFDGTICFGRFWQSLPENEQEQVRGFLFNKDKTILINWMRGEYTSEEIVQLISNTTLLPYQYLWDSFVTDCSNFSISVEILNIIQELRQTYYVILITGNMDSFDRFTLPALNLKIYFDYIVNSYTEKSLKTDNEGATFLKYLHGNIEDSVLIEDSITSCEVFKKLGGKSLQVTTNVTALTHLQSLLT